MVGGVTLSLVAAGRRTASAYPSFVVATHGIDAAVYNSAGFSPPPAAVLHLPQVIASAQLAFPQARLSVGGRNLPSSWGLLGSTGQGLGWSLNRWRILAGRLPDPNAPGQALVSYDPGYGIHVGSVMHLAFYAPDQARALFSQFGPLPAPGGPTATVRIVGIEASVGDFPAGSSPSQTVYLTPALVRRIDHAAATAVSDGVRLRHGAASIAAFTTAVAHLHNGSALYVSSKDGANLQVERSIHLQAVAWWVLAAVAGLAGVVVIAQVLIRQAAADAAEYPALRALGMGPGELFLLGLARMVAMALAGATAAVGIAFALSPLTPIGEAARSASLAMVTWRSARVMPCVLPSWSIRRRGLGRPEPWPRSSGVAAGNQGCAQGVSRIANPGAQVVGAGPVVQRPARIGQQNPGLGHAPRGHRAGREQAADQVPELRRAVPDPVPAHGDRQPASPRYLHRRRQNAARALGEIAPGRPAHQHLCPQRQRNGGIGRGAAGQVAVEAERAPAHQEQAKGTDSVSDGTAVFFQQHKHRVPPGHLGSPCASDS